MPGNEPSPTPALKAVYSDLYPLDESYAARGDTAPSADRVEVAEIPEPYHSLLVHRTDMTSTLEKFHGETLHIEVLNTDTRENAYWREVVLILDNSGKRVEFGAIKINLELFPEEARAEILRARKPLGRILNQFNIGFASRPAAYFRLESDKFIDSALQLPLATLLYGRRNELLDAKGRPLAEIVEILPP